MAFDDWLVDATPADLAALAGGLLDGRIATPPTAGSIQLAGFGQKTVAFLEGLRGTDPKVIAWMLQRLADERRRADDRHASVARLVWSGASEGARGFRDTRSVLDSLFARAERSVLVSTFVVYNGRAVFAALAKRMTERPELEVEMYVHLASKTGAPEDERDEVNAYLEGFTRDHWPGSVRGSGGMPVRVPAMYYDPEGRNLGATRTTLHAKCVVVDERWAFVTSANFTEAAQERNIEAGVLLDHPRLAAALAGQFRALREAGRLRRMGGGSW